MTTKEQEKKALDEIRAIVGSLGEGSYLAATFDGCFEIAEENIRNDFACSMKQQKERAEKNEAIYRSHMMGCAERLKAALLENEKLKAQVESTWHDCEGGTTLDQERYEELLHCFSSQVLSEDEAKNVIYEEFGFATEKVKIIREVSTYEANIFHRMRKKETFSRDPVYDATDWNYIRFDCSSRMYEMVNGELCEYCC